MTFDTKPMLEAKKIAFTTRCIEPPDAIQYWQMFGLMKFSSAKPQDYSTRNFSIGEWMRVGKEFLNDLILAVELAFPSEMHLR